MLAVFSIIAPIFLVITLGYVAVRAQVISVEANSGFGRFVLYFGLPALVFRAVSSLELTEAVNLGFVGGYAIGSLLAFVVGILIASAGFFSVGLPKPLVGMGMSCSNSGYIGYPILLLTFANPPITGLVSVLLVENLLMIPMVLVLLEYDASRTGGSSAGFFWKALLKRVAGSPMMIAILSAVAVSVLGIPVPPILDKCLEILAGAAVPIALFFMGGSLVGGALKGAGRQAVSVAVGKLLLHPLLVAFALSFMEGVSPELKVTAILFAAMPMLGIYPIIGSAYGHQAACSATLLIATFAASLSIPLFLSLTL